MQDGKSFRFRLVLCFWLLLFLTMLLPSWYFLYRIEGEIRAQARNDALQNLRFVRILMDRRSETFQNVEQVQQWIARTAEELGPRITYIARSGDVLCDSLVPFSDIPNLGNFAGRIEFIQAIQDGFGTDIREGRSDGQYQVLAAQSVSKNGGLPAGVLRIAIPAPQSLQLLDRLRANTFFLFAAALLISCFLARLFSNRIRRSSDAVADVIRAVRDDDYSKRVRFHPSHEFYSLAASVDEMTRHIDGTIHWITEEKRKLEAVLNGMQEGVMVLDSECRIQIVNRALSELIPGAPFSLGRRPLELLVNIELHDACNQVLSSGDKSQSQPHFLQLEFGKDRIFDVSIVRLSERDRNLGIIVVFHDISKLKRLERVRQDFVANVSHELRTPLTSIKGYTETLLSEPKPDQETERSFLQVILKNTNHMVKMVDDLLQLARLEAQLEPLKPQEVNPSDALMAAWRACYPIAEQKRVALSNLLPADGIQVRADHEQIVQVFRNLLENGIRYSPQGSALEVACRVDGKRVVFSLHDNGPGIARQHQQRIFERFYRVEKHRGSLSGSTGLGLAICKHIIENHGGRIWVSSPDSGSSGGTTFFFSLFGTYELEQSSRNEASSPNS